MFIFNDWLSPRKKKSFAFAFILFPLASISRYVAVSPILITSLLERIAPFTTTSLLTISLTYITGSTHNGTGTILCLVLILPSLLLSKWLSQPFKSFFKHLNKDGVEELRLEGKIGMLQSDLKDDKIGRVRIMINDDPILIYGKSKEAQSLKANTEVYILQKSNDKKYYYVKPL